MSNLPLPTIDHVVINVRDQLDAAELLYRRLGFDLTPRGYHTLGSMNNLAIFGTDYLELIAVPPGGTGRSEILAFPTGLNGLVFATEDAAQTHGRLVEAGVDMQPIRDFSRPVEYAGGVGDAAFRTTHLGAGLFEAGRIYFCEHRTRGLVWRDEWRRHPNGVVGVTGVTTVSADPEVEAKLMAAMFGADMVQPIAGGFRLVVGLASFDMINPRAVAARYGDAAPEPDGRADYMACLSLRVKSLDVVGEVLAAGGVAFSRTEAGLLVAAEQTMGATLEFVG